MNRAVQGITISIGGRCQGGWTESGGMQEQPRMSPLLFLSSFPFSFLFLTFWPFQQCWAFRGAPEEQVHSDCTRQRMGPPVLLPYFVLSCHAGTQPLSDFAAGQKRVGGACAAGDTWSPIAGGLGRGIPWSGFLGLQISLVCVVLLLVIEDTLSSVGYAPIQLRKVWFSLWGRVQWIQWKIGTLTTMLLRTLTSRLDVSSSKEKEQEEMR